MNDEMRRMLAGGWHSSSSEEEIHIQAALMDAELQLLAEFSATAGSLCRHLVLRAFALGHVTGRVMGLENTLRTLAELQSGAIVEVHQYGNEELLCRFYVYQGTLVAVLVFPRHRPDPIGEDGAPV